MRYPASEKVEIIRIVEQSHLSARRTLAQIGIQKPQPRATWTPRRTGFLGQYRGEFYSRLSGQAS